VPFATGPQLSYVGLGRYKTVGSTLYVGRRDVILIPDAFTTDLASVPRIFWSLLPPCGAYERSAVLHDFLCEALAGRQSMPDPLLSPSDVDGLFRRVMRECGVGLLTRWVMWTGVRWGALFNPHRRAGWLRDAPAVVAMTALGLAAACVVTYGVDHAVHAAIRAL